MKIAISGQYGDPNASKAFWPLQKKMNASFKTAITKEYFQLIKVLSIGLRVSGDIQDFKSSGIERLKFLKRDKILTIDLVYSKNEWITLNNNSLEVDLTNKIRQCLELMIVEAKKIDTISDEKQLISEIEIALIKSQLSSISETRKL
ncbi:hypothetical protein [Pseudomonas urmiensis]|uniref:hypothetical protein n=1 Tax=Pseudomonas urmiensis TaxID=2745493 RepID=UPI003C9D3DB7